MNNDDVTLCINDLIKAVVRNDSKPRKNTKEKKLTHSERRSVKTCLNNMVKQIVKDREKIREVHKPKKDKKRKREFEGAIPPCDYLGFGCSNLSLDRVETKSVVTNKKMKNSFDSLPEEYQVHLRSWVCQRKYQWKMDRDNDEYERMLGVYEKVPAEMNCDDNVDESTAPSENLESGRIFEGNVSLPRSSDQSYENVVESSNRIHVNHYFRAAGGMNAIVILCEAVKKTLQEQCSVWGVSSRDPCGKINWKLVSQKMTSVSDRWNPSFCRAIWQFVEMQRN